MLITIVIIILISILITIIVTIIVIVVIIIVMIMMMSPSAKVRRVQVSLCQLDVRVRGGQPGLRGLLIMMIMMMMMMTMAMMMIIMILRLMTNILDTLVMNLRSVHGFDEKNITKMDNSEEKSQMYF